MPRKEASALVLRTRLMLVRFRSGDTDRSLVNHLAQIVILTRFVRQAGYGELELKTLDDIEMALGILLVGLDETGKWAIVSDGVMHGLTEIINEYDRMLGTVRMETLVRAGAYLDRLVAAARPTTASQQSAGVFQQNDPMRGAAVDRK